MKTQDPFCLYNESSSTTSPNCIDIPRSLIHWVSGFPACLLVQNLHNSQFLHFWAIEISSPIPTYFLNNIHHVYNFQFFLWSPQQIPLTTLLFIPLKPPFVPIKPPRCHLLRHHHGWMNWPNSSPLVSPWPLIKNWLWSPTVVIHKASNLICIVPLD